LFFFNGKTINRELLAEVLKTLQVLIASFKKFHGIRFNSSSLFIAFDGSDPSKQAVKFIDFDRYEHDEDVREDKNISEGLENIAAFLEMVASKVEEHEQKLLNKELRLFREQHVIIPAERVKKYEGKKTEEEGTRSGA
jgi:hypothetical protein